MKTFSFIQIVLFILLLLGACQPSEQETQTIQSKNSGFRKSAGKSFPSYSLRVPEALQNSLGEKSFQEFDLTKEIIDILKTHKDQEDWQSFDQLKRAQLGRMVSRGWLVSRAKGVTRIFADYGLKD